MKRCETIKKYIENCVELRTMYGELPDLKGSEEQVILANDIRAKKYIALKKVAEKVSMMIKVDYEKTLNLSKEEYKKTCELAGGEENFEKKFIQDCAVLQGLLNEYKEAQENIDNAKWWIENEYRNTENNDNM